MVDNGNGSITINYAASEENPTDVAIVNVDSGVTATTSIESYYVKNFTDITKVTKDVAASGMQTLLNKAGLSTISVGFDQVKGGFTFSETNDGAISLQAPQSAISYSYDGSSIAANDSLALTLVRGASYHYL